MLSTLVQHVRRHAIAYLALTCSVLAMGGAAYAAGQLPVNSVGERQIQNHVIDPVKWDTAYTTGFVRRWATVSPTGATLSTSPGGQSKSIGTGSYVVTWGDAFAGWCAPIATVLGGTATPAPPTTTSTTTTPTTTSSSSSSSSTTSTTTTTTSTTTSTPSRGAYADASIVPRSGQSTLLAVATYNSQGQPTPEPFSVAVVCGPGAGSGQPFPSPLP